MASRVFELHPTGHVVLGLWCEECTLPSLVQFEFAIVDAGTLRVVRHVEASACTECGSP